MRGSSVRAGQNDGLIDAQERVVRAVRRVRNLLDRTPDRDAQQPTSRLVGTAAVDAGYALLVTAASVHARAATMHDGAAASLIRAAGIHLYAAKHDASHAARHLACADACQRAADRENERAAVAWSASAVACARQLRDP